MDLLAYQNLRRETKQMIKIKKKEHAEKLKDTLRDNPKGFWSIVKSYTSQRSSPNFLRDGQSTATDSVEKANLLNTYFHSVFSKNHGVQTDNTDCPTSLTPTLSNIELTKDDVARALKTIDPKKACGPDNIPGQILKNTADVIAPSLCRLFNLSLSSGSVPTLWKCANVTPVFKKDDPMLPSN